MHAESLLRINLHDCEIISLQFDTLFYHSTAISRGKHFEIWNYKGIFSLWEIRTHGTWGRKDTLDTTHEILTRFAYRGIWDRNAFIGKETHLAINFLAWRERGKSLSVFCAGPFPSFSLSLLLLLLPSVFVFVAKVAPVFIFWHGIGIVQKTSFMGSLLKIFMDGRKCPCSYVFSFLIICFLPSSFMFIYLLATPDTRLLCFSSAWESVWREF